MSATASVFDGQGNLKWLARAAQISAQCWQRPIRMIGQFEGRDWSGDVGLPGPDKGKGGMGRWRERQVNPMFKLWDVTTGREIRTFKGYSKISSVVFSPDGRLALKSAMKRHRAPFGGWG